MCIVSHCCVASRIACRPASCTRCSISLMSTYAGISTLRDTMICMRGIPVTFLEGFVHSSNLSAFFQPPICGGALLFVFPIVSLENVPFVLWSLFGSYRFWHFVQMFLLTHSMHLP